MKFRKNIVFPLIIAAASFVSSMAGYIFGVRANTDNNNHTKTKYTAPVRKTSGTEEKAEVIEYTEKKNLKDTYILRESGGKLSLFIKSDEAEKLYETYDISVKLLPQSDRELLEEGIETDSLDEALQMIEDYL